MKKVVILLLALLIIPSILAINVEVTQKTQDAIFIKELDKAIDVEIEVENLGHAEYIKFHNLLGFEMSPTNTMFLDEGETKIITLTIHPREDLDYTGFYGFEYFITGTNLSQSKEQLIIKIIELKEAFEVGSSDFDSESNSLQIFIQNKENFNFGEINTKFNSAFFNLEESFTLGPREKKEFKVELDKEQFKKLIAGFYTLDAKVDVEDQRVDIEGIIRFVEKDILISTKKDYGLIINTKVIEKKNEGNTITASETIIKKNIISRLFTTFSPEPDIVDREGAIVYYTWNREIKPGESLDIIIKTNWFFPLIAIIFIVTIVVLTKLYSRRNLILHKRVSFVKAKGGEFALKISIIVKAKTDVEKVNIIDRLPPMVKVYDKFRGERPTRVDEKTGRIEWNLEDLNAGETRMLHYIIYSKLGIVGKFALPNATGIYEKEGKLHESESNKTFFVAEPRGRDTEEE